MIDTPAFRLWGHIRFAGYAIEIAASIPVVDYLRKFVHSISAIWFGIVVLEGVSRSHRDFDKSTPGLELKGNLIYTYQYTRGTEG
jgi:hypothetical protein